MVKKIHNQFLCSQIMLPEHRGALNKKAYESRLKEISAMPDLDEQRLEEMDRIITRALREKLDVRITAMCREGPVIYEGRVRIKQGKVFIGDNSIAVNFIINIEEI